MLLVGIETDRGAAGRGAGRGWVPGGGGESAGGQPLSERHTLSRAKSDRGDARMLADLVRTDRHHHRQVAGDSGLAEVVKVLARGHQQLVWAHRRQANIVRSA